MADFERNQQLAFRSTQLKLSGEREPSAAESALSLPQELFARAERRLRWVALGCVALIVVAVIGTSLDPPPRPFNLSVAKYAGGVAVVLSLAMALATRLSLSPSRLLDWGQLYEVLMGFCISLAEIFSTYEPGATIRGVSWVCVWVAIFPLALPATPGKAALVALVTAATGPLALMSAIVAGLSTPPPVEWVLLFMPNFMAAVIAVVLSQVLYRLGRDVARARKLGSYQLERKLGSGGMGEVWIARHGVLARPAAVKFVRPEMLTGRSALDSAAITKRFVREAEVTASLTAPTTIQLFDFGVTDDGTLYYVMELLEGRDLESLVHQQGRFEPARVVHVLRQVCESLEEAHELGLIHRDLKPANVVLCRLGTRHDCVKVLDFGLAAHTDRGAAQSRLTHTDVITGTPAYLAPETVTGDHPQDARTDLYALGCVGYFMLTGTTVFQADTAIQMAFAHAEVPPEAPSERLGEPVDAALEAALMRCLAKSPVERPASATELKALLGGFVGEPWDQARAARVWPSP